MFIDKTPKNVYIKNHHEYMCDTRDDIANLPTMNSQPVHCEFGSTAFVISDSSIWMLNSENKWVEI